MMIITIMIFICDTSSLWGTFQCMNLRELVRSKLEEGLTQRELAAQVGVSQGTINNILAGIYPQKLQVLERFAGFFRIEVATILGAQSDHAPRVNEESPVYRKRPTPSAVRSKRVPLLSYKQAAKLQGKGTLPSPQSIQDYVEADIPGNKNFAFRVSGNAMEPEFHDGDILIINPDIRPKPNEFVATLLPESDSEKAAVRQLKKVGTTSFLHALNPIYQDVPLHKKQQILGKVVWKQKYY